MTRWGAAAAFLVLGGCRISSEGLAPEPTTLDDGAIAADSADGSVTFDTALPDDAIVSDSAPLFPVDDGGSVPECTGKPNGTVCGSASPRKICVGGECVPSRCGDGIVDMGEDCDDKNEDDGDTCPGDCRARCKTNTQCDDFNACSVDVCDLTKFVCAPPVAVAKGTPCKLASGDDGVCNGTSCTAPTCGNKTVESPEECDDGNAVNSDGCRSDCTWTCKSNMDCDDGNACNGAETCDVSKHTCKAGMPKVCSDMNACTTDRCVAPGGACTNTFIDADGDGDAPTSAGMCGKDCHDGNPRVNPAVTAWFTTSYTTPSGSQSFDWNCSGTAERRFTVPGKCEKVGPDCIHTWGWVGGTPPCGGSDFVVSACEGGSCKEITSGMKVEQECH